MSIIIDQFLARVVEAPAKTALVIGDGWRSYADLEENARRYACRFSAMANGRRLRIAVALEDCAEFVEIILACLWSGHTTVIADPEWPPSALAHNFEGMDVDLLVSEEKTAAALQAVLADLPVISRNDIDKWLDYGPQSDIPDVSDDAPFLIGFTSGSTGRPKAFCRDQRSWLTSFAASDRELPTRVNDIMLSPGLMKHTLGLYAVLYAVVRGATAIGSRHFGPAGPENHATDLLDVIESQNVTQMALIPPMAHWLARAAQRGGRTFPKVRQVTTTAMKLADMTATLLKTHLPKARIIEYYGAAEIGFITIAKPDIAVPASSVGRAMHGVSLSIRDPQSNTVLPAGEIGLVSVKSPYMSSGYLFEFDQGGFRISADGTATVGDFGWLDEEGNLTLSGRENNLMISGGHKVYPAEIEAVIRNCQEIETACVFGMPNPIWGDVVCLATTPCTISTQALSSLCFDVLPPERCPQVHFMLDEIPHTSTGKVALTNLRKTIGDHYGAELAAMTMGTLKAARESKRFIQPAAFAE